MAELSHPSLDDLADLHEGLLPDELADRLRSHVEACSGCSAAMTALDDVQAALAAAGASSPALPPALAARIDKALHVAGAERSGGVVSLDERRASPRQDPHPGRGRRVLMRVAAAAAAVAVVGGGVELARQIPSGADNNESASSADAGTVRNDIESGGSGSGEAPQQVPGTGPASAAARAVTPATLASFAARLSNHTTDTNGFVQQQRLTCQPPQSAHAAGAAVASIRWRGRSALLVVDPKTRRATVYACSEQSRLYSTSY